MTTHAEFTKSFRDFLSTELERYIEETPIRIKIDGMEMAPEENSIEIDRSGGEINIDINLGIRQLLINDMDQYDEEKHWGLFSETEVDFLLLPDDGR